MAESQIEGRRFTVLAPGIFNRRAYTDKDIQTLHKNTLAQGVDLPLRLHIPLIPTLLGGFVEDKNDQPAKGWWPLKDVQLSDNRLSAVPRNIEAEMLSALEQRRERRYWSVEVSFPDSKAHKKHDLSQAWISAIAPVSEPAFRPQQAMTELMSDDGCREWLASDDWTDEEPETETRSSARVMELTLNNSPCTIQILGEDRKERPIGDPTTKDGDNVEDPKIGDKDADDKKETKLEAEAETETAAEDTPAAELETENTTEDLAAREARIEERELASKKAKIEAAASALNKELKLHKDDVADWTTAMLAYDDKEADDNGQTALDRQMAFEARSRSAKVELGETSTTDRDVAEEAVQECVTSAQLQLRRALDFLRVNHGENTEGAMDLSDRFDAVMKAHPELKPWEAFNQAAREVYGKDSE